MRLAFPRPCIRAHINSLYASPRRVASTSLNPYPFPVQAHPTPHQLFHLPLSASQKEIKARYFDLVKLYHPDAPLARSYPPDIAQARFHAISNAYDVLRGHKPNASIDDSEGGPTVRDLRSEIWRAKQARKADLNVPFDDRWKDRVILGAILFTLGLFVAQTTWQRQRNMGDVLVYTQARERERAQARNWSSGVGLRPSSSAKRDEELLAAPEENHNSSRS